MGLEGGLGLYNGVTCVGVTQSYLLEVDYINGVTCDNGVTCVSVTQSYPL